MIEIIARIVLLIGAVFGLIGGIGILRMPDVYNRIHAETLCVVGGTIVVLIGLIIMKGITTFSLKVLIIVIFLFITNPVGSHALAKAAHKSSTKLWPGTLEDQLGEVD